MGPQISHLPVGRLHFQHGPIDLICEACGTPTAVAKAYRNATLRFDELEELVAELPARCYPRHSLKIRSQPNSSLIRNPHWKT